MPDCAALAFAVGVDVFDVVDRAADGEELVVAGDLADAGVKDGEAADEVGAAEGVDGVGLVRLPPAVPELFRGADGRVACLLAVEREEELSEVKEVRDVLSALVADQPGSGFPAAFGRPLVLDDDEGDAVAG